MRSLKELPAIEQGSRCLRMVYFCRDWWDGASSDVVILGKRSQGGFFRYCQAKGEVSPLRTGQGTLLRDEEMSEKSFAEIMRKGARVIAAGLQSQSKPLIMTHFDDHYWIRDQNSECFVSVKCGKHTSPILSDLLDSIFDLMPELECFYQKQNEHRR